MSHIKQELSQLRDRILARAENAYCDMISVSKKDESLGWEIKVERGEFGRKELDSHIKSGELLGRHRALMEVYRNIQEILDKQEYIPINQEEKQ